MAATVMEGAAEEEKSWRVWRDRTADTNDLKSTFSRVTTDSTIPSDVFTRAHFLCAKYLGGAWKTATSKQFSFKQITGGMSNLLFLVALNPSLPLEGAEPRRALLRVHCQSDIDQLLTESVVFTLLSERSLGPKLLGVFPGGRFEQFIPSRPLTCQEISQEKLIEKISPMIARVHSLHVPIGKEPQIINRARCWLRKWMETPAAETGVKIYCTKSSIPQDQYPQHVVGEVLMAELEFVEKFLGAINSPIVFSHNDLQEGNILLVDDELEKESEEPVHKQELALIDFEYCDYNYRGFDLGNHMCEYGFDYTNEESPFYHIFQDRFEETTKRSLFCKTYLDELYALRESGVDMPPDLATGDRSIDEEAIEREAALFMPISNLFWACWALLNAEESTIAFGYSEYARDRLALYFQGKKKLQEFILNKDHGRDNSRD